MALSKFQILPGHEIRGMRIRLYPDRDTEVALRTLEGDLRHAWNWLVGQTEISLGANEAYAIKQGWITTRLSKPDYEGLSPDEAKITKEAYYNQCRQRRHLLHEAVKDRPECAHRRFKDLLTHFGAKHDYQLLARVINWTYKPETERLIRPCAHSLQALAKNYFQKSDRRKKHRKQTDSMPLQVRSGDCFKLGSFGSRGKNPNYYDCQVSFNGLKIRGRLPGKSPEGRILEGVSIIKEADGWWASIKQEVLIRQKPAAIPGSVVGIDTGLDIVAAISEVRIVSNESAITFAESGPTMKGHEQPRLILNSRGRIYAELIASRQAQKRDVGRLHQKAARHVKHVLYNELVKPLACIEIIKIEKLHGRIGQMGGSSKTSAMRLAARLLRERYGDRVREVECHYTSQDCSKCGSRSKKSWSYEHGRYGECPNCGYREDRDVNAARNVAAKPLVSLAA